jgi:hypothetical protein
MALKLKALLEGYAWERKADGSLPTLKDAIAVHEANQGSKPDFLDLDKDGNTEEPMKSAAKEVTAYKDASRNELALYISKLSAELRAETDPKKQRIIKQDLEDAKQQLENKKSIKEGHNDHGILDMISEAENIVQRLRSNMATNSVLQREEKMGYLRAYDELLDLLSDIGVSAEME